MARTPDTIQSLYRFRHYPPDFEGALCREYALMKLGVMANVQHFARLLLPVVEQILEEHPHLDAWVLTAPPASQLSTAAILLSEKICEMLQIKYTDVRRFSTVRLYNQRVNASIHDNAAELWKFSQYSRSTWADRISLIGKTPFSVPSENFAGRGIVFVNDINVTGASQAHISQVFAESFPDKVHWLYLIDCDKEMGREHPYLENELNNAGLDTLESFAAALASNEIMHTAKCISKLFGYELEDLVSLLAKLNPDEKNRLWEAVDMEFQYEGGIFREKWEILRKGCRG